MQIDRRKILGGTAATIASTTFASLSAAAKLVGDIPIIDCHIHLFDATRPQGAPYKGGGAFVGGVALPGMYAKIAKRLGIVGAIEVDASPWVEDNLWVLETIEPDPFMLGTLGNLQPDKPDFPEYLARYAINPLYRGIRYGNLWGYSLATQLSNPVFIQGLKLLAQHDMTLETGNQNIALLQAAVRVNDSVPALRIVLGHLPAFDPTPDNQADFEAVMKEISQRKNIWAKMSEIVHPIRSGASPRGSNATDAAFGPPPKTEHGLASHREHLEMLMQYMGEDRVLFGSDWPNAVGISEVPETVALVREYFSSKSREAAEKFFWKNSIAAYKWVKRSPDQPSLS